jgi:hypothetical protein
MRRCDPRNLSRLKKLLCSIEMPMFSSKRVPPNRSVNTDAQQHEAALRQLLRAGYLQR